MFRLLPMHFLPSKMRDGRMKREAGVVQICIHIHSWIHSACHPLHSKWAVKKVSPIRETHPVVGVLIPVELVEGLLLRRLVAGRLLHVVLVIVLQHFLVAGLAPGSTWALGTAHPAPEGPVHPLLLVVHGVGVPLPLHLLLQRDPLGVGARVSPGKRATCSVSRFRNAVFIFVLCPREKFGVKMRV